MSDQKAPGVFIDDSIDTRPSAPSPDKPVTTSEIIGANWLLGRQDQAYAQRRQERDAYVPVQMAIKALDDQRGLSSSWWLRGTAGELPYNQGYSFSTALGGGPDSPAGGGAIDTDNLWKRVQAERERDPSFLKDVPAKNAAEFTTWVTGRELAKRRTAQDVVRRQSGFSQQALGFGTSVLTGLTDPVNIMSMPLGGGAETLFGTMAREALVNGATQLLETPSTIENRSRFGEETTSGEVAYDVAAASAAGFLLPAAGHLAGTALAPALRSVAEAGQRAAALRELRNFDLSNSDIAAKFSEAVPQDFQTPEQAAALNVIGREADVSSVSPYIRTPGGLDANAERLGTAIAPLSQPASAARTTDAAHGRATTPLTQSAIIRHTLIDLEGGAAVVHYSQADGGVTKYGIAQKFNPDVDVANLTEDQAAQLARQRYWLPEMNRADPRVAAIAFDANYINSPKLARRILSEAGDDPARAISIYRDALNRIADTVEGKAKYKRGWNNRVDKLSRFVGDADGSAVRLDPEPFGGVDDASYRASQEALNAEELRLADDTPRSPDPVREYVDRLTANEDVTAPELQQFAANNRGAIDAELSRRQQGGADVHADLTSGPEPLLDSSQPSPAEAELAVRQYVEQQGGKVSATKAALELGVPETLVQQTISQLAINSAQTDNGIDGASLFARHPEKGRPGIAAVSDPESGPTAVYREGNGRVRGVVNLPSARDGGSLFDPTTAYVAPEFRRRGIANRLYDALADAGHDVGAASGRGELSSAGARFVDARNRPSFEEPTGQLQSLDPAATGVADPNDAEAKAIADSTFHDLKALVERGDGAALSVEEGGIAQTAKELVDSIARDEAAITALKGCL